MIQRCRECQSALSGNTTPHGSAFAGMLPPRPPPIQWRVRNPVHHIAGSLDAREATANDGEGQKFLLDHRQRGDVGVDTSFGNALSLAGDGPRPLNRSSDCTFRKRCRHAMPSCAQTLLELLEVTPGHFRTCLRDDLNLAAPA